MSDRGEEKGDGVNSRNYVDAKRDSVMVDGPSSPKRIKLGDKIELKKVTKESLIAKFQDQDGYINHLENKIKQSSNSGEVTLLRESEEKLKLQQQESTRRENVLVMRLATKEQEMQELLTQIHDLKQAQNPAGAQLRSTLLDPAVNIVFQRMKAELDETKEKLEQAQNDLSAWKFTPDSVTGKKLMAKCRMLIQENQELGRQLSQGRVAQLEAELALQKKYSEELKTSQDELNEFVIQLDEEVEGMQSTILALQKQLKGVKSQLVDEKENGEKHIEQIRVLEKNLDEARTQPPSPVPLTEKPPSPVVLTMHGKSTVHSEPETSMMHSEPEASVMHSEPGASMMHSVAETPMVHSSEVETPMMHSETQRPTVHSEPGAPMIHSEPERPTMLSEPERPTVHSEPGSLMVHGEPETAVIHGEAETPMMHSKPENSTMQWEPERKESEPQKESRTESADHDDVINHTNPSVLCVPQEEPRVKIASPSPALAVVSTPPGSTTFSISQILGEPKKTPPVSNSVLQGAAGGDAVVTKLPYPGGGLKDPEKALGVLRTDGTVVVNGGEEGTQPVVT